MDAEIAIDVFHAHEALDRTHMVIVMIDEFLANHPFVVQDDDVKTLIDEASERLAEAYQRIGNSELYKDDASA